MYFYCTTYFKRTKSHKHISLHHPKMLQCILYRLFFLHLNINICFSLGQESNRLNMSTKLERIPTKSWKYGQYFYNTKTVRATLFPQKRILLILHHPDAKFILFSYHQCPLPLSYYLTSFQCLIFLI